MVGYLMSEQLEQTIKLMAKMPGMGQRSARRAMVHLLMNRDKLLKPLIDGLTRCYDTAQSCGRCGALNFAEYCNYCDDNQRDGAVICVVEQMADLWAMERLQIYRGQYHILGGVLSALNRIHPEDLRLDSLFQRCHNGPVKELILATNATMDGQTTAFYIQDHLMGSPIKITRLAHGVPAGGELEYMDDGTLAIALKSRREL